jgi:5'-3' exonuclease
MKMIFPCIHQSIHASIAGTEFMFRLGIAFRRWIAYKMKTDPFWQQGAEVVFSGTMMVMMRG